MAVCRRIAHPRSHSMVHRLHTYTNLMAAMKNNSWHGIRRLQGKLAHRTANPFLLWYVIVLTSHLVSWKQSKLSPGRQQDRKKMSASSQRRFQAVHQMFLSFASQPIHCDVLKICRVHGCKRILRRSDTSVR